MTGFGSATQETERHIISVEVKSLNSKTLDLSLRLPRAYSDREIEVRNLIGQELERGKISVNIDQQPKVATAMQEGLDEAVILNRYHTLKQVSTRAGILLPDQEIFKLAYQWPANAAPQQTALPAEADTENQDWPAALATLKQALAACQEFRKQEGQVLANALLQYGRNIESGLEAVRNAEKERAPKVRARLLEKMSEWRENGTLDNNRLEQEMIYYLEKLDIAEEMVRLKNHLDYFNQTMREEGSPGKKLGFISQELGREINTIGSKANDATLQQTVIMMKEELEKIKEQSLNLL